MPDSPPDSRYASRLIARFGVHVAAVMLAWSSSGAQTPARPTNLQVLPAQITPDSLINVMGGFTRALGVRCAYCHVAKNGVRPTADEFASDDRETPISRASRCSDHASAARVCSSASARPAIGSRRPASHPVWPLILESR